jgi:hypothetical protein
MQIEYKKDDLVVKVWDQYDPNLPINDPLATPQFTTIGSEYTIAIYNLEGVEKMTTFTFETLGSLQTRYLTTTYRVSRNTTTWTDWLHLDETIDNFIPFDPKDKMHIEVKFKREGTKEDGNIRLISWNLEGILEDTAATDTVIIKPNQEIIIRPPFVYKVFRIDGFETLGSGDLDSLNIQYRFSQDNTRTWTPWEPLTTENISTSYNRIRINPIRFFQIEYKVTNPTGSNVKLQDLNLIGDFQNVTEDYSKTNLYGIRVCCQSGQLGTDSNGNPLPPGSGDGNGNIGSLGGSSCGVSTNNTAMTNEEKAGLFNPYNLSTVVNFWNKTANDAVQITGHKVQYFITDPDGKGIDYTLHEFGLFNIVCEGEIKVAVENNQFPDGTMNMNVFDLALIDSFQVQITKDEFKRMFGVQRRPSKEDLLYFCDINRLFIVEHAQQFRQFNNNAVSYKVVLKKYNKAANVKAGTPQIEDRIRELTKNSTIDELFGIENNEDKAAVANKPQQQTLSKDPIRLEFRAEIIKELIENSTTIVAKQFYDMGGLVTTSNPGNIPAVTYKNLDSYKHVANDWGYTCWFNLNNYLDNEKYGFYYHYDDNKSLGWKSYLEGDVVKVHLNGDQYDWDLSGLGGNTTDALQEETWYAYVININQRSRKLEQWIYKRNVDFEEDARSLGSTALKLVWSNVQDLVPVDFELENVNGFLPISDWKMTNIRLFDRTLPIEEHNRVLNEYLIGDDSRHLVFADNANTKIILTNYPFN